MATISIGDVSKNYYVRADGKVYVYGGKQNAIDHINLYSKKARVQSTHYMGAIKMEKIIVRNKVLNKGYTSSNFIRMTADYSFKSFDDFIKEYGLGKIMNELFEEYINSGLLSETVIFKNYKKILLEGRDNEDFKIMYKIDQDFCVSLTENIYIYHIVPPIEIMKEKLIPWNYLDSKIYAGDTWWDDDDTIIKDIKKLSIVDFIKKYKAY
ncbi:hypothetical protein RBH29_15555 [Herbivorax sp. ANBcel31]|uniref:hypothetical protein n=1 Tax=Herbivorax sp. ANBcel31 TaxID=3069754 RepID=UPI0027B51884|nr:hypothetical protein [Herbivorax sp. ANBcel31]MDQ2087847.1 hypothetical protein [Herbivorax sp. ANBcel31]